MSGALTWVEEDKRASRQHVRNGEDNGGMIETCDSRRTKRVVVGAVGRADVEPQGIADRRPVRRSAKCLNRSSEARSTHPWTFIAGFLPLTKVFKPCGVNASAKVYG